MSESCACGCGRLVVDGLFWAQDGCLRRWIRQINEVPLPPVRTFCGSTYTDQPATDVEPPPTALEQLGEAGAEFATAVKDELRPPLERTLGWLSRWLDRLGKGNQQ